MYNLLEKWIGNKTVPITSVTLLLVCDTSYLLHILCHGSPCCEIVVKTDEKCWFVSEKKRIKLRKSKSNINSLFLVGVGSGIILTMSSNRRYILRYISCTKIIWIYVFFKYFTTQNSFAIEKNLLYPPSTTLALYNEMELFFLRI